MLEKIFFLIIATALLVITFILKQTNRTNKIYKISVFLQVIGIVIKLISLPFKINTFFMIITYLIAVILPLSILILKYYKIDIIEKIYILLAKYYIFIKNTKSAKKILLIVLENNNDNILAHKLLAEIYEKEGRN